MNVASPRFVRPLPEGCELLVQVVPNAGRTQFAGVHGDALRVRVAAPALDGRANAALVQWLAAALSLPRGAVSIAAGEKSRRKRVHVACATAEVEAWLRTLPLP